MRMNILLRFLNLGRKMPLFVTVSQFLSQALEKRLAHFCLQEYNVGNQGLEYPPVSADKGTENASLCRKSDLFL